MKNGAQSYENKSYFVDLKDHANIGLSINGLSVEEIGCFDVS